MKTVQSKIMLLLVSTIAATITAAEQPLLEAKIDSTLAKKLTGIINTLDNNDTFNFTIDEKLSRGLRFDISNKTASFSQAFVKLMEESNPPTTLEFEVKKAYAKDLLKDTLDDEYYKKISWRKKVWTLATGGVSALFAGSIAYLNLHHHTQEDAVGDWFVASTGMLAGVAIIGCAGASIGNCLHTKSFHLHDKAENYALGKLSPVELAALFSRSRDEYLDDKINAELKNRGSQA